MSVKPKPDGYQSVIPYLVIEDVGACLDFAAAAFGGEIIERVGPPDGPVMHGEIRIGDSVVMMGCAQPPTHPAMPAMVYMYVDDCDATYQQALAAGGESIREPSDQFYGDRSGGVRGPQGVQWWLGTHIEDVSPEEIARRAAEQGKH